MSRHVDDAGCFASVGEMDVIGHNLANVNTVTSPEEEPFRAKYLVVQERADGDGVQLREVVSATGDVNLDPSYIPALAGNGYGYAWEGLQDIFLNDDLSIVNLDGRTHQAHATKTNNPTKQLSADTASTQWPPRISRPVPRPQSTWAAPPLHRARRSAHRRRALACVRLCMEVVPLVGLPNFGSRAARRASKKQKSCRS